MMKKITLLAFTLLMGMTWGWAQTYFFENFSSGTPAAAPAGFTVYNEDNCNVNNPALFTNGAWVVVDTDAPQGLAAGAQSWTNPPCQVDDWLITPAINLTTASTDVQLRWKARSFEGLDYPEDYEVWISTSGDDISDFTLLTTITAENATWTNRTLSLSAYAGESDVRIAFVLISFDQSQLWIDDIFVGEPVREFSIENIFSNTAVNHPTDASQFGGFYPANFDVMIVDHSKRTNFDLSVTVRNDGVDAADSIFLGFYLVDFETNAFIEIIDSIGFSSPLLAGETYTHTFTTNLTTAFPSYGANSALFMGVLVLESTYNVEEIEENYIVVSPAQFFQPPYTTSFEVVAGQSLDFNNNNFSWKGLNLNNDQQIWLLRGFSDLTPYDGNIAAAALPQATNDILESPELRLQNPNAYRVGVWARTGFGFTGTVSVRVVDGSGALVSTLGTISLAAADSSYRFFSFNYSPASSRDDYKIQFLKGANSGIIALDLFSVIELLPPTVTVNLVNSSLTPGNGVEYCDSTITINYVATGPPATLSVNWGDGNITTLNNPTEAGTLTHTYSALGTYSIVATATNIKGTGTSTPVSVDIDPLPNANALFVVTSVNQTTGVVTFVNNSTPNCPGVQYIWDFGDGNSAQGNQSTHTYTSNGTFTITLTMNTGVGGAGAISQYSVEVGPFNVTSINEIDFTRAMNVYPNPATDMVNVAFELSKMQNVEVSIIGMDGRTVATKNLGNVMNVNTDFNVAKLNSGVYMVKVKTEDGLATQRFVVSHK
jgi:hypothetical protein